MNANGARLRRPQDKALQIQRISLVYEARLDDEDLRVRIAAVESVMRSAGGERVAASARGATRHRGRRQEGVEKLGAPFFPPGASCRDVCGTRDQWECFSEKSACFARCDVVHCRTRSIKTTIHSFFEVIGRKVKKKRHVTMAARTLRPLTLSWHLGTSASSEYGATGR